MKDSKLYYRDVLVVYYREWDRYCAWKNGEKVAEAPTRVEIERAIDRYFLNKESKE